MKKFIFIFMILSVVSYKSLNAGKKYNQYYYNAFLEQSEIKPCPNEVYYYQVKIRITDDQGYNLEVYPDQTCSFSVTNGTKMGQGSDYVYIKWNDNGQLGELTVENIYYQYNNAGTIDWPIKIRTLSGITPSSIIGEKQIAYCDNTSYEFLIDTIKDKAGENTDQYNWIIPNGWISQGITSNGVDEFVTTVPSISVTPDDCTGNKIKVKGVNSSCSANNSSSNTVEKEITRIWPNFVISGNNVICTIRDYSISHFSSGFSVNWTPSYNISLESSQGEVPATFSKNGNATGTISATISINSCPLTSKTITKTVWLGTPAFTGLIHGDVSIPISSTEHYWVDASEIQLQDLTVYDWDVTSNLEMVSSHYYQQDVYVEGLTLGRGSVYFISSNTCGSNQSSLPVHVTDLLLLEFTPNPSTGETTLSIQSVSDEELFDETAEWELEIYDQTQLLKEKKTKLKGKEYKIQTASWQGGIYFVRVKYKDEILQGKLMVKM